MNLIETHDLAIGYGNKVLINNINFCLQEKQICCLLGANGGENNQNITGNFNRHP